MLSFGDFRSQTCRGLSRRAFLQFGASLPLSLSAASLLNPARAASAARARSVIFVWLWGAPSHIDTFDPKPDAPPEVRGPFSTIAPRTPGMRFTELLPRLADSSRLFSVVRSHVTSASGHPEAGTIGLSAFAERPGPVQPCFGAIVAKQR